MTTRTLTALYETTMDADAAKTKLVKAGVDHASIDIHDESSLGGADSSSAKSGGLMAGLKRLFGSHEDHHIYAEGVSRGHYLLTAKVEDAQTDQAIKVLDTSDAVNFEQKQAEWKGAGGKAPAAAAAPVYGHDDTIKIVEERLVVGKREVELGGVRVRSYVVETPVSEQVGLREENVSVERHPVDRAVTAGDDAFQDRTIEMRETGEEAVVGKQAFVREELTIKKNVGQRTQEVKDTVRHTEVEVERLKAVATPSPSKQV